MRRRRIKSITTEDDAMLQDNAPLAEHLTKLFAELDKSDDGRPTWQLSTPYTATVLIADGATGVTRYKKLALVDQEFFVKGVRTGKRDGLIFEFEPVDTQPFLQMEMGPSEIAKGIVLNLNEWLESRLGESLQGAIKTWQKKARTLAEETKAAAIEEEVLPNCRS